MSSQKKETKRKEKTASKKDAVQSDINSNKSELSEGLWSVISFEECIAGSLKYDDAMVKMAELTTQHVSGLCIITDDAAARISK